jgi:hypothetical protein
VEGGAWEGGLEGVLGAALVEEVAHGEADAPAAARVAEEAEVEPLGGLVVEAAVVVEGEAVTGAPAGEELPVGLGEGDFA